MALTMLRETVTENPYIPILPTEPQAVFLTAQPREIMYGGAGGGGKSAALLAAAIQYVQQPKYAAIIFRRRMTDLNLPGALMPLAQKWLTGTDATFNAQQHQWKFPSGATLTFSYLENENDKFRYKSAEFQFIGFDELTAFSESQYRYLFFRLRRLAGSDIPLRMRSATNPGDIGHEWVRRRFIDTYNPKRLFIPALLTDNPYLDEAAYRESLAELDPVTRRQVEHGDWDVRPEGNLFKHEWFTNIVDAPPPLARVVRCWDFAATEPKQGRDPDWTVGVKAGLDASGNTYILDIQRFQHTPGETHVRVAQAAAIDGPGVTIRLEQEPGSSGKDMVWNYQSRLNGYAVRGIPSTGDKVTRSLPFSAACERKAVVLVRGNWNFAFLDELCAFPQVAHDDQVDAAVGAFMELTHGAVSFNYAGGFKVITASNQ